MGSTAAYDIRAVCLLSSTRFSHSYTLLSEVDGEATTLRVINEAVRNLGRTTPLETYSIEPTAPKREGDWTFVPRGSQSVRHNNQTTADNRSAKTANSLWKGGISRVISFNKKPEQTAARRSVRSKTISNPIPHQSSLEAAERIGTDIAIHRPRNPVDSIATANSNAYSSGSSGISRRPPAVQDNPVALEAKDFDCSSDSDFSPSPSPAPATPLDVRSSLTADDFQKFPPSPSYAHPTRPSMPPRSPGSFSRPTPAAYPLLLRTNLDRKPSGSLQSPVSLRSPSISLGGASVKQTPTRPARPPVPTRNPARPLRASASSENTHPTMSSTLSPGSAGPWVRRSPSHGALRI